MELDNGDLAILGSPEKVSTSISRRASQDLNGSLGSNMVATTKLDVGPVIAFFPNKNGKTFECTAIPRKISLSKISQSGHGSIQIVQAPEISHTYSSFIATATGNEIVVLYNDEEENITKQNEKLTSANTTKNVVLAEALIKNGKLEYRKQIGQNLKGRFTYFIGDTIPTSSSSVIFPIGKEGENFNGLSIFYSNWCFIDIK